MRLIALQHQSDAPPGLLADWARERGLELRVVRPDLGEPLPGPGEADLIAVLGSHEVAVRGQRDWVDRELEWLAGAGRASVPVLGICFGAQALAVALGGARRRAPRLEVGWVKVSGAVEAGPWFAWHEDAIEPPPDATVLAHNRAGVQAFSVGRHIGLQFHPEVTPAIVDSWAARGVIDLASAGISRAGIVEETQRLAPAAAKAARRVFDGFLRRAPTLAPPVTLAPT
jgi:GMP synthase-like glutamine amidotransferase